MDWREERRLKQKSEREGMVVESHNGSVGKLVEYINFKNCLIEVESGHRYIVDCRHFKNGCFKDPYIKTKKNANGGLNKIHGVGICDTEHKNRFYQDGEVKSCPIYDKWRGMIRRCYSEKGLKTAPVYKDVTVCDEWLYFTKFRDWVTKREWEGLALDKDIIKRGNKVYCPDYCAFVDTKTNLFAIYPSNVGVYPIGASLCKKENRFIARCGNPFTGKAERLGAFDDPMEAHKVWQARKHELACQLADEQSDERVAKALRERYAPDKDWTKA
jgi:hypothetical protein